MRKPKPKRKFAACAACRGKGMVFLDRHCQRVTAGTAAESGKYGVAYCTCELGEAKREAAKGVRNG